MKPMLITRKGFWPFTIKMAGCYNYYYSLFYSYFLTRINLTGYCEARVNNKKRILKAIVSKIKSVAAIAFFQLKLLWWMMLTRYNNAGEGISSHKWRVCNQIKNGTTWRKFFFRKKNKTKTCTKTKEKVRWRIYMGGSVSDSFLAKNKNRFLSLKKQQNQTQTPRIRTPQCICLSITLDVDLNLLDKNSLSLNSFYHTSNTTELSTT